MSVPIEVVVKGSEEVSGRRVALLKFADGSYVGESFVRFDGMTWPRADGRARQLNHMLRYGNPTKSDLLMAAEIIGAYVAMVDTSARQRAAIVRRLRLAREIMHVPSEPSDPTPPALEEP